MEEVERAEIALHKGVPEPTEEYPGGNEEVQDSPGSSDEDPKDGMKGETLTEEGGRWKEEIGETRSK
ncbi:hypothetical protein NDU88_002397 [Pleurodeles waltl]|uniref:Uncharacterized protein n=2 Tax=Pleurodeles waltl TaxID=8319 RepID=A0AAV7P6U0_PLEWA|nr:hypothetical protein NDU88_002397 [Pleurodeles waltl]